MFRRTLQYCIIVIPHHNHPRDGFGADNNKRIYRGSQTSRNRPDRSAGPNSRLRSVNIYAALFENALLNRRRYSQSTAAGDLFDFKYVFISLRPTRHPSPPVVRRLYFVKQYCIFLIIIMTLRFRIKSRGSRKKTKQITETLYGSTRTATTENFIAGVSGALSLLNNKYIRSKRNAHVKLQ